MRHYQRSERSCKAHAERINEEAARREKQRKGRAFSVKNTVNFKASFTHSRPCELGLFDGVHVEQNVEHGNNKHPGDIFSL